MARLYSYVVRWDTGFAPNPFHGFCTLALCKPQVRNAAEVGDWIIGTGSKGNKLAGVLVYAMRVTEILTFNEYWHDDRFRSKSDCGPNISHETKVNRVLVSNDFVYFGGEGPPIPEFRGVNVCKVGPGHRCVFPDVVVGDVVTWIQSIGHTGCCGIPANV